MRKVKYFPVMAVLLFLFTACPPPEGGEIPVEATSIEKRVTKPDGSEYSMQVAVYIDAETTNPLNAGDYFLDNEDSTPYFDYIILGAAQIKRPAGTKRVTLFVPPGLQHILDNRVEYLRPLQNKGHKIILGITGGQDDVSFGNIVTEDDINNTEIKPETNLTNFAKTVADFLEMYQLDGVEFNDTNAAKLPANPASYPYPDGYYEGDTYQDKIVNRFPDNAWDRVMAWGMDTHGEGDVPLLAGNKQFCLLISILRDDTADILATGKYMSDKTKRPVFVREINNGAFLVEEPKLFTSRESYVNFYINSDFDSFGTKNSEWTCGACGYTVKLRGEWTICPQVYCLSENMTASRTPGKSLLPEGRQESYSPLAINLDTMTPPLSDDGGNDIEGFSQLFMDSETSYELLFYNGLVPASAEQDSRFESKTQADIFSISSEIIFGHKVIRNGGDQPKNY